MCKIIINCIVFSIVLIAYFLLLYFQWVLCIRENINKTIKYIPKIHPVVQRIILIVCTIMYNNLHMQSVINIHSRLMVKQIFMQHICIHNYPLLKFCEI